MQGVCSVYEKFEGGEIGSSKSELIRAYRQLMTLYPRSESC